MADECTDHDGWHQSLFINTAENGRVTHTCVCWLPMFGDKGILALDMSDNAAKIWQWRNGERRLRCVR